MVANSVLDLKTLNVDPDPEFLPNVNYLKRKNLERKLFLKKYICLQTKRK